MPGVTIPIINDGDLFKDVRLVKLNPVITEVNRMSAELYSDSMDIATLKSKTVSQDTSINTLSTQVSTVETEVSRLGSDLTNLTSTVGSLNSAVSGQGSSITNVKTSVDALLPKVAALEVSNTRVKSSMNFTNLSIPLADGVVTNLISVLKLHSPTSGAWGPFVDLQNSKIKPAVNDNRTLNMRCLISGAFDGAPANTSAGLSFEVSGGNVFDHSDSRRTNLSATEFFRYQTFFSVDKDDQFTQEGAELRVLATDKSFTIQSVRLIIEQ